MYSFLFLNLKKSNWYNYFLHIYSIVLLCAIIYLYVIWLTVSYCGIFKRIFLSTNLHEPSIYTRPYKNVCTIHSSSWYTRIFSRFVFYVPNAQSSLLFATNHRGKHRSDAGAGSNSVINTNKFQYDTSTTINDALSIYTHKHLSMYVCMYVYIIICVYILTYRDTPREMYKRVQIYYTSAEEWYILCVICPRK